MKKYFFSGLALLLPVVMTLLILSFFINLITSPFVQPIHQVLQNLLPMASEEVLLWLGRGVVLLLLLLSIFVVGCVGRHFLVEWLLHLGDWLLHRTPFVNRVYKSCKDLVHSVLSPSSQTFSKVVLVPYPHREHQSIGLITKDAFEIPVEGLPHLVPVFVPGTPNPSVGFLLLFEPKDIVPTDLSIEDAMKFVVSCGIVTPGKDSTHASS